MATPTPLIATDAELTHGTGVITTNCHGMVFVRTGDLAFTNLRTSSYRWQASGTGTNEWYLQTSGGANPSITDVADRIVYQPGAQIALRGTAGSLYEGQWDIADNDSLGYETLYIRTFNIGAGSAPDSITDPDAETDGHVWTAVSNPSFSWGDGNPATAREVRWDFIDNGVTTTRYGFNASYRYGASGSVRLTITDSDGTVASTTRVVTKASYSPTTYYIDATGGNDSNDGLSSGAPKQTIASAITAAVRTTANIKYLLKRGETFSVSAAARHDGDNCYFGAYGSGADPIVLRTTAANALSLNGSDLLVENIQCNGIYDDNATPQTQSRVALINVTPTGDIAITFTFDRMNLGLHMESCVSADLSGTGGSDAYFLYSVKRSGAPGSLRSINPIAMRAVYECANDYGCRTEATLRVSGSYMSICDNTFEATNITSDVDGRNKGCGPRFVGGTHIYVKNNTFTNNGDTSALTNPEQGTQGVSWGPADGQSWPSWYVVIEDNLFVNSQIQPNVLMGDVPQCRTSDVTIRRNRWSFPYASYVVSAIAVGSANQSLLSRWRFVHNTINADKQDKCRILNVVGQSTGLWLEDWEVQNNLYVNPSLRVTASDSDVSGFVFFNTDDAGESEFAVFKDNVYATPGTGAGSYPTNFASRYQSSGGTGTVYQTLAQVNSTFGTGNVLADTSLNADFSISSTSETAATSATALVTDVPADSRGFLFYTTGPVGAYSFRVSSSVNSGGGSFPLWI